MTIVNTDRAVQSDANIGIKRHVCGDDAATDEDGPSQSHANPVKCVSFRCGTRVWK